MNLISIFIYGNETMVWKEKERSMTIVVQVDNLTSFFGINGTDIILNVGVKVV